MGNVGVELALTWRASLRSSPTVEDELTIVESLEIAEGAFAVDTAVVAVKAAVATGTVGGTRTDASATAAEVTVSGLALSVEGVAVDAATGEDILGETAVKAVVEDGMAALVFSSGVWLVRD